MRTFPGLAILLCLSVLVLVFIPTTTLFARHVGLPSKTYNGSCDDGGGVSHNVHVEHTKKCRNNIVVQKNKPKRAEEEQYYYKMRNMARPLQIAAGSRLPDCSHACGSCTPCRLVTVSFVCSSLAAQSEPCPISYRCLCNGKSYPVP